MSQVRPAREAHAGTSGQNQIDISKNKEINLIALIYCAKPTFSRT